MNELDELESNDALIRFTEGGGPVPADMHHMMQPQMSGLGQQGAAGPWYKSPVFLAIAGIGVAAILFTIYSAKHEREDSDGSFE